MVTACIDFKLTDDNVFERLAKNMRRLKAGVEDWTLP